MRAAKAESLSARMKDITTPCGGGWYWSTTTEYQRPFFCGRQMLAPPDYVTTPTTAPLYPGISFDAGLVTLMHVSPDDNVDFVICGFAFRSLNIFWSDSDAILFKASILDVGPMNL